MMTRLGKSNVAIAEACGVNEKTVRKWRGRDLTPKEVAPPIPSDMEVHFPDDLYREFQDAKRGLRVANRMAKRAGGER